MANETPITFSIIVPVYNGAQVIERCIKSISAQTHKDFELIIIDDGSTDKTRQVCEQYSNSDNRAHYHYQINKGVSAARNQGLRLAKNEYVLFVDADDFISPTFLSHFCDLIADKKLDDKTLIFQDFVADINYKDGKRESFKWCKFEYGKYNIKEAFRRLQEFDWLYFGVPFAKLYRLSIIKTHQITFNEKMSFKEDLIFLLDYIRHIDTLLFDTTANYHYIIQKDQNSLSNTTTSFENEVIFFRYIKEMSDTYIEQYQLTEKAKKVLYQLAYLAFFRCLNSCMYQYKIPMNRQNRLKNIRSLSTKENLAHLLEAGIIDSKMKRLAYLLLKTRLYTVYDMLNKLRYRLA